MSYYLLPNTLLFCPEEFTIQMAGNVHVNTSPLNGATKTVEFAGDRWIFSLRYGRHSNAELPPLRAFWNQFKGAAHVLQVWNLANPVPLGTMRGNPTAQLAVVAFASQIQILRTDGTTSLLPGDWIGITLSNGEVQTVEITDSDVGAGLIVAFTPPLRRSVNAGAQIYWFHPLVNCLLASPPVISHGPGSAQNLGMADGFSVDLVEFIL